MFRRSRSATEDASVQDASDDAAPASNGAATSPALTPGKGRPTPKRSDAERRRRQPYTAPKDRKEAGRAGRVRQRGERDRKMEGMRRGEEWALPPRDRGPARALIRDYVDSRRRLSEFYMYGLIVLMVLLFVRTAIVQSVVPLLVLGAVLIMLVEGIMIGRRARSLTTERLPGTSTRGIAMYAAMRSLQIRKLRVPKPRIKPGDSY